MQLHTFIGSPNGRKVEATIDHLGLEVEFVDHDFIGGGLRTAQYVALNPNGSVPTLVDGGLTLWESNAIMQYLADKAANDALFPRDPRRRADVVRWLCWEQAQFNRACGILAFETVAKPRLNFGPTNEALVAAAQVTLARFAPVLERQLDGRSCLLGDGITIADYAMVTFESYRTAVPFDWSPFRNINAYFDRVAGSVHWQRAVARNAEPAGRQSAAAE